MNHCKNEETIYLLGGGAVGAPLSAFLTKAGKRVILLRFHGGEPTPRHKKIQVACGAGHLELAVKEQSFSHAGALNGWVVIAAKAHANAKIALELARRTFSGPIVLLQNGLGVERPFLQAGFTRLVRGVLYVTSERTGDREFSLRVARQSPLGIVTGPDHLLSQAVSVLSSPEVPFIEDLNINRSVWRKTIINAVFNSICTIIGQDNNLFERNVMAMGLARKVVEECTRLARAEAVELDPDQIMEDIGIISRCSTQLISTLQDVRAGRPTEMEFMNLELARIANRQNPAIDLTLTAHLGQLLQVMIAEQPRQLPSIRTTHPESWSH